MLVAFFQPASGHNIDSVTEKLLEFPGHPHQVEKRTVLAEVDQKVNVTVRAIITTSH